MKSARGTTRRQLLGRAAAVATAAPAAGLLTGCSGEAVSSYKGPPPPLGNTGDPSNPFNVDPETALDVVIFDGGFGDRYAIDGHELMYQNRYPKATVNHLSVTQISELLNPALIAGRPPDVVNNSGAHQVPADQLYSRGQLTDLTLLLDAPSYDDPNVKVRDTLRPGIITDGSLGKAGDERMHMLFYGYTAYGLWYNGALFADRKWTVPQSWPEFLDLCDQIRGQGIAPFIYQGQYPYYLLEPFMTLAVRHGGTDVVHAIDSLKPDAWKSDSIRLAAEAWYAFGQAGFIHHDAAGSTHTGAQDLWNNDDAAFVPCGSWLENEQRAKTPPGFQMQLMGLPPLEGSVAPGMVAAGGTEAFIVPAQANNRAGGLEYLRMMLSKDGSREFSSKVASLTCVAGAEQGLDDPGVRSTNDLLKKAGADVYAFYFDKRYRVFADEMVGPGIKSLLTGAIKPDKFVKDMQAASDSLRRSMKGQSIKK